jgi:DNA polymerase-1
MPVIQLQQDYVEADDIISYVNSHKKYKGWYKVIVSSDKDFFQLCHDPDTYIWRPIQKDLLNETQLTYRFKVHPINFALVRAVDGDSSDNLKGVPRVGMKTMVKYFPQLENSRQVDISEILTECSIQEKKKSIHKKLLEHKELVISNYKIMQLYEPSISLQGRKKIDFTLENFNPLFHKMNITKMLMKDGQGSLNLSALWVAFKKLTQ